jgi:hypothetical protein
VENEGHQILTPNVPGHAFGIEASQVRKIGLKADKKPKPLYGQPTLDEDQTTGLLAFIQSGYGAHNYVNQRDILSFIEDNYGKRLIYQWMASFLKSHDQLSCQSVVRPQEILMFEVASEHLGRYINLIQKYVPLVPTELLFHKDKSGFSDWEERKLQSILISLEGQAPPLYSPTSRKTRLQTLRCCTTTAEDTYCLLLVSAQPVAREVFQYQIRDGIDLQIETLPDLM